jgi:protein-S-isoprenylcysteine O-methyltransferase Ste14
MVLRLIVKTFVWYGVMGALLFLSAGTLAWAGAWAFLAEMIALGIPSGLWLARRDPELLAKRLDTPIQSGQSTADKVFISLFLLLWFGWLVLMGLDAVRFGWSWVPLWAQVVGGVSIALSIALTLRTFRENSFAAPVVKIQEGQKVITTGPYAIVRHPMYVSMIPMLVGIPLLLGSWWGLAVVPVFVALVSVRIRIEERELRAGLPGYAEYTTKVRYRLIPGLW